MRLCSLIALLLIIAANNLFAQKIIVRGIESDGRLTWKDFTSPVDANSDFEAYTWYKTGFRYKSTLKADTLTINDVLVTLELDSVKTWSARSKQTAHLLNHE